MQSVSIKEDPARASAAVMPFQVRGRFFTAVVLQIAGRVDQTFHGALERFMQQSPQFFSNAPIVLDLDQAAGLDAEADFLKLVWDLRRQKLFAVGVQNATERQSASAFKAGLVTLKGGREADLKSSPTTETAEPRTAEPGGSSLLITEPVRSGQRIFADRGDLVVVASVSAGAELIATGNIHVYGPLRGRALAGVNGDMKARIFCQSLEADLIAIAGLYKTSDDLGGGVFRQRVQAFLRDESLCIEPLK